MACIGIDARLTYYRVGGISTYIRRLISALEKLEHQQQFTIFHSRKAVDSLSQQFRSARLWTPCHHRLERLALSLELARHRLDLLHSPDFIPPLRGARRHVITVHDLTFIHYPQYLTAESRRYYNGQIETAVRQADHILVDSEATRRDLIDILSVPQGKITVHMLGVDPQFRPLTAEQTEPARAALGLPPQYILFVGTFEPRKNIAGLLQAYHDLLTTLPDAPPLVLVGRPGWNFEQTLAQAESLKLGERLIWHSAVSDEQLPAVYNMALALVTPSFYEGFGLPALEAMACGTVPVVSDRSSLPEIVGDVGLLIDPDDPAALTAALQRVLSDADWRQAQQQAGLQRAAGFTWEETARIVLETYHALL